MYALVDCHRRHTATPTFKINCVRDKNIVACYMLSKECVPTSIQLPNENTEKLFSKELAIMIIIYCM